MKTENPSLVDCFWLLHDLHLVFLLLFIYCLPCFYRRLIKVGFKSDFQVMSDGFNPNDGQLVYDTGRSLARKVWPEMVSWKSCSQRITNVEQGQPAQLCSKS